MRKRLAAAAAAVFLVLVSPPAQSAGAGSTTVVLANNMLRSISVLTPLHPTDPARVIGIGVGLDGSNPAGLAAYIAGESDPSSPLYQQFLDSDQFEQQFGVPQARVDQAVTWMRSAGLSVQQVPGVSEYLLGSGTVNQVQSLLQVSIADFHIDSGDFYANTNAPTVPAALGVIGIAGLNNLEGPRLTHLNAPGASSPPPATISPSAQTGLTTPSDLWSIYGQPAGNKGEGQKMAIFGWGTTKNTLNDLRQFEAERQLPGIPLSVAYYGTEAAVTDSSGEG